MKLGGITERNAGEIRAVDLHDCEIGERIGADQFCREDPLVAHGDANIHGAFHHVVVGDDVTVGGNDHAAAETVFNARLGPSAELSAEWIAEWPKLRAELLYVGGTFFVAIVHF